MKNKEEQKEKWNDRIPKNVKKIKKSQIVWNRVGKLNLKSKNTKDVKDSMVMWEIIESGHGELFVWEIECKCTCIGLFVILCLCLYVSFYLSLWECECMCVIIFIYLFLCAWTYFWS